MSIIIDDINKESLEPKVGLGYQHLDESEIRYLNGNNPISRDKLHFFRKFKVRYSNLKELESNLCPKKITANKGNNYFPHWYILRLIEYKRVSVDYLTLDSLRIKRSSLLTVNSYLIDLVFIEKFESLAIEKLKYAKDYVQRNLTITLIRGMLFYQLKIDDFIKEIVKFYNEIDNLVTKGTIYSGNRRDVSNIINVLKQMKYDIDFDLQKSPSIIATGELLKSRHKEFRNALNEYAEFLKSSNKMIRTISTELSHLREFFNFLNDCYPDISRFLNLNNSHIREFIKEQKSKINIQKKHNTNETINHRLEALRSMLNYYNNMGKYTTRKNIITKYDLLKETNTYPVYRSEKEIFKLINTVINDKPTTDTHKQCRLCLIILIDTGRRVHEVLCLNYNSLEGNNVYFHKTKQNEPTWQNVGEATINSIKELKEEYARNIKSGIYSRYDNMTMRRLFPSYKYKGTAILSKDTVSRYFDKIQIENGLIDDKGEPIYTIHDNKDNFVSNLLGAGVSAEGIAKFLNQKTDSLLPYEVNNQAAVNTLKRVEEKGLLIGDSYNKDLEEDDSEIVSLLREVDVINRNKQNLILKINNPKEAMPLAMGYCTDYTNFEICGDLICLACDEFETDSYEEFLRYALKMYNYIYQFRRDEVVKSIEDRLLGALEKVYNKLDVTHKKEFKIVIREIKKEAREELKKDEERK